MGNLCYIITKVKEGPGVNNTGHEMIVCTIDQSAWGKWHTHKIKPMPISEWWLPRMGLVYDKAGIFEIKNKEPHKSIIVRPNGYGVFNRSECTREIQFIKQVKYVHELQNIYYAITGMELTLNKDYKDEHENS